MTVLFRWLLGSLGALVGCTAAFGQAELIVKFSDTADAALVATLQQGASKQVRTDGPLAGVTATRPLLGEQRAAAQKNDGRFDRIFVLTVPDSATFTQVRDRLDDAAGVAYVQPNYRYRLDTLTPADEAPYNDALYDSLEHLVAIRAPEAWTVTQGTPDVRIGFVDTGVFFEHPDLEGQFWVNPGEDLNGNGRVDASDFDGIDNDGNGYIDDLRGYDFVDRGVSVELGDYFEPDPDASEDMIPRTGPGRGHGTLIAGALGAGLNNSVGVAGVAPGCRLVPLRAFGNDGEGEDDDVAAAIVYAAEMGLEVLNLSFGDTYDSPVMHEAIQYAVARGTVVVASAGNDGGDWPHYPSDYDEVLASGWLSQDGQERGFRASHGVNLDVGAPGSLIYTTLLPQPLEPGETAYADSVLYGRRSGSSMAAPLVSGAAALLRTVERDLTPEAIRGILTSTAVDIREPGWDQWTGAGRLDVAAALRIPYPARVTITTPEAETGFAGEVMTITGSTLAPLFASYELSYAAGDDEPDGRWTPIGTGVRQIREDVLGTWNVAALPDTTYVLRLSVSLNNGQMIEDRRRIFLDKTPPEPRIVLLDKALSAGRYGVMAELTTNDFTRPRLIVTRGGERFEVESDRGGRRHGLLWRDETGDGGLVTVQIEVPNASGLVTTTDPVPFTLPVLEANPSRFTETTLDVPHGYLMPKAADFDRDGLKEIVFNRYQENNLGDTLSFYEWAGAGFANVGDALINVFPRDVADTDGDGREELLTQVSAVTLLLEFGPRGFEEAFLDTTGLTDLDNDRAVWGTILTDLDQDGRGEIVSHNRVLWRLLEYDGTTYTEAARLENPTDPVEAAQGELDTEANGFSLPRALAGDFDDDGQMDLLVGDTDGDWMIFEATGNDTYEAVWWYQTPRYNAGSRFAAGDFDGDGVQEFVTYSDGWRTLRTDREYEAEYAIYYIWDATGDNQYALTDSLVFGGPVSNQGSVLAADFDRDGRDELIITHAPDLYVFRLEEGWELIYHRGDLANGGPSGIRSIAMVVEDFSGNEVPDLVVSGADQFMHLFTWTEARDAYAPPRWVEAVAESEAAVSLAWRAPGADSVEVFATTLGEVLDPVAVTREERLTLPETEPRAYALRAWYEGASSALSERRTVRPHAPARVVEVAFPEAGYVSLTFNEALHAETHAGQFTLSSGVAVEGLVFEKNGRTVTLRVDGTPAGVDTLRWAGVRDAEGTMVEQTEQRLEFAVGDVRDLTLVAWEVLDGTQARLVFSKPLDAAMAGNAANYRVEPRGSVAAVGFDGSTPDQVVVTIADRALGATGLQTSVLVLEMRAADGSLLAAEGNVATLVASAEDLSDVYVFPNPFRETEHAGPVMIAGIPRAVTVQIYSVNGHPVRTLEEQDGNGGVEWDLADETGLPVPSGIYLVRVASTDEDAVIKKLAIIR